MASSPLLVAPHPSSPHRTAPYFTAPQIVNAAYSLVVAQLTDRCASGRARLRWRMRLLLASVAISSVLNVCGALALLYEGLYAMRFNRPMRFGMSALALGLMALATLIESGVAGPFW